MIRKKAKEGRRGKITLMQNAYHRGGRPVRSIMICMLEHFFVEESHHQNVFDALANCCNATKCPGFVEGNTINLHALDDATLARMYEKAPDVATMVKHMNELTDDVQTQA